VGVDDGATLVPKVLSFAPPAPNPARGSGTTLSWTLPASHVGEHVNLSIYDLSGRRVHTVTSGLAEAGRHTATWNLRTDDGTPAKAGVFFARLTVGSEMRTQKLLVVR